MSTTQIRNEINRMTELAGNIQNTFVLVLVYTVIIVSMMSALLGGIVLQVYYGLEFIFNKVQKVYGAFSKFYEASFDYENAYTNNNNNNNEELPVKKPLIDETWCNVSVKNIINYEDISESEEEEESESEEEEESESEEEEESESEDLEDIHAEVEEEILSLKKIEDLRAEEILN
jgi:hypothetical protein